MGYWDKRQAQIMYEQMEDAEKTAKEIADIYAKSTRELNFQIEKIFDRFADKHELTEQEARKLLGKLKNPTDIAQLRQALANDPKNKALLAELESPAYRARIERLENLQTEIDRMMKDVYMQEKTVASAHYANVFSNSYYQGIYNIQRMAGFQFSFSAVDSEMLDRMLSMEWSGANYSSRIWNNTSTLAKELREQLILSYLTGKKGSEIASEIANKFGVSAYKARRLVRTESCFQANMGQLAAYEEADIEKYMIVATLDLRTSPVCREMDGRIFERTKASIGSNMPPFHPFCRSTTVAVFGDEDLHRLKRRARDPVTGESKLIPADTNYKQWYQKNVANNPKAQAAEKMVKNGHSAHKDNVVTNSIKDYSMAPYGSKNITKEVLANAKQGNGKIKEIHEFTQDDIKYIVDGKHVVLDYTEYEKHIAEVMKKELGYEVAMMPRVLKPQNVQTPDFLINTERYDLKSPIGSGKEVLFNMVKGKQKQADNFIFDITNCPLEYSDLIIQSEKLFTSRHTRFVNNVILLKDDNIIAVLQRNRQ